MASLLLADEQKRVLDALGYPLVDSYATYNTGLPADILQPQFRVYDQIDAVDEDFIRQRVLSILEHYDCIEAQIRDGAENTAVDQVDSTKLRNDHLKALRDERHECACDLASAIGADVFYYSPKYRDYSPRGKGNSINRRGCC